jgi:phosphatidylinositol alpha-1,6-mannosyltransferase
MKVLLVTHYYSGHRGGIEIVAGELARRMPEDVQVTWAASDGDPIEPPLPPHVQAMPMRSSNLIESRTGLPFPLWSSSSLRRLRQTAREADVVHLHDIAYLGNWTAFAAAARHDVPVVVTQHIGLVPYRNPALRTAQRALHAIAGRKLLGGAKRVVFVSSVVRDYFSAFVRFSQPPIVISNGVDATMFREGNNEDRTRARAELGLDPDRPVLLFVGRFVEKKGLHIISLLRQLVGDAQFILAGRGPIDPRQWAAPNVTVIQDRRGAALEPLYRAADLLILPSVGEGLPLVVQEAMSCGTPVLVNEETARAVNAPPRLLFSCPIHGRPNEDAARWAAAIRDVMQGPPPVRTDIAAFARAQWSWDKCAEAYLSLYGEAVK